MQSKKKPVSPLLYYVLISSLTNLAFIMVGIAVLALFSLKLTSIAVQIIVFLLLWKGALVGFVTWISHKRSFHKEYLMKFIGIYLGRFFGIFVGGFLGVRISAILKQADLIGFIVGALAFYFAGRWIGSRVSTIIGGQLDKVFFVPETEKIVEAKSSKGFFSIAFALYFVILPWLLVTVGLLMNYFDLPIGTLTEYLSISRIIAIALSAYSICAPWVLENRWLVKIQAVTSSPESAIFWLGLTLSIVPALYGFILFIAMGASILELSIFAAISSIAAIIWSMNKIPIKQKAG